MQPVSLMVDAEKGKSVSRCRAGAAGAWVCLLTLLTSWQAGMEPVSGSLREE